MKGRSHRPPPSAPLEDWGDGQWTVDCSCGVNFDDGEEMVSCDECGVWVHTHCSHYVRGEVSFACHKCKIAAKYSRSVIPSAANNFVHDTEETEVAQLLVELPTKADHPPLIPPVGASYRPPFRLWAHVPMEERVHVQGVPGGDPSLFRGLSSTIFSPELWKCTGYVPKKFNFKYKEFPCWEDEEMDKASRGADALFSLSKEIVQDAPARTFEKILSPDGSRKKGVDKFLLDTRPFGYVKKERNKLRVLGSHLSKRRKEELVEEKESSGRKRFRGDFDKALNDVKEKVGHLHTFNPVKEDSEDGGLQIDEPNVPGSRNTYNRNDAHLKSSYIVSNEGMDNNSKTKHLLVFKTSKRHLSDEEQRPKLSIETPIKVENIDPPDEKVLFKLDTATACHVEGRNIAEDFFKQEDVDFKGPKGGSYVPTVANGGSTGPGDVSEKKNGICTNEAIDDQALENSYLPHSFSGVDQLAMDDLPQNQLKSVDTSFIVPEESITLTNMQPEEHKSQVMQNDSELSQCYKECIHTSGSESVPSNEVVLNSAGSLRSIDSIESDHVYKICCTASMKLSGPNHNHFMQLVPKEVGFGKGFLNSTTPYGSKLSVSNAHHSTAIRCSTSSASSTQNSTASAVPCSPARKVVHMAKQQRVRVTTSNSGTFDTMMTSISEEKEQEVLQQPERPHPTGAESVGLKSLQAGKNSRFSPSKCCSMDSKEQPYSPPCQTLPENLTTYIETVGATRSPVQTPASQLKTTSLGSTQKNDKTTLSNTQQSPKLGHSLVMQASTSANAAAPTLSDEELALLLHQELNSSPRVPRVPRMRQTTNTQFASPTATSMLSKRACPVGREQVSFFRRKHKEDAVKDGSRHSRDAIGESRRICRRSPETKLDGSSIFNDGLVKKGKGSRSCGTAASSKANVAGTSVEGANGLAIPSEGNGARASLRRSPASVDGDGTLAGLSLPGLIDEIMSKGKCSTYEELCNSVRPFWHSLRKPNGERYAYFSHSQAVLDCLRNRSEWAHLIDRGPKTNASKRRRKLDTDAPVMELEYEKSGGSHREDFPKGKRNVRKRRLLERGVGNGKEATNSSALSDDDRAAQSQSSSEETECHASYDTGPEACSSSSGDSD